MAFYQFYKKQIVNGSIGKVWDFISSPKNLKEITPDYMGFEINSKNLSGKMYPGMIISYTVKPVLGQGRPNDRHCVLFTTFGFFGSFSQQCKKLAQFSNSFYRIFIPILKIL